MSVMLIGCTTMEADGTGQSWGISERDLVVWHQEVYEKF